MSEELAYLGGQKVKLVTLLTAPIWYGGRTITEYHPWHEGISRRSGKYTKRYADNRQKHRRNR